MGRSIDPIGRGARRDAAVGPHPALIVSMSLRPGIPWRVALQQSPLPLPRLELSCDEPVVKARLLQRTATCPFFCGLTKRPHSRTKGTKGTKGDSHPNPCTREGSRAEERDQTVIWRGSECRCAPAGRLDRRVWMDPRNAAEDSDGGEKACWWGRSISRSSRARVQLG